MDCNARLPCPSPSPGACSNLHPLSQWWHPTISSSVVPFSSCLLSFPASGSFPMSRLFTSGGQNIGASVPESVLPMNIQDWLPLGLIDWMSLQSKRLSRVFSNTTKASILWHSAFFTVQLSHPYMTTGKTIALTRWTFVDKVIMSLLFNMLSKLVITSWHWRWGNLKFIEIRFEKCTRGIICFRVCRSVGPELNHLQWVW